MLKVAHEITPGMARELEVHAARGLPRTPEEVRALFPDAESFCRSATDSAEGRQYLAALARMPPGAKVLDLGAGPGKQSVMLALRGFRPTAVEPSPDCCVAIAAVAAAYGLGIEVVQSSAEALDALPPATHDAALFSASLHHCDDPARAVRAAAGRLKPGGILMLLNEPHLQRFRTKAWFEARLAKQECVADDYGGNEHIHYRHEYRKFLADAGLTGLAETLAGRYQSPESYLQVVETGSGGARAVRRRRWYYAAVARLQALGPLGAPPLAALKALSLVQLDYAARKPG